MYHLSVKPISRSSGRTATAAAAYRAGAQIADLRTGELHDYTRKRDIVHSEIVLPAESPAWAEDRSVLWNAAEAAEKRKDARVARDYEVAIPKELTPAQGIELVRDFSQGLVDRYGVAVDFNVHRDDMRKWDGSEKGWQGYHAHILTSTRKLGRDGFGDKAEIELSDTKRKSLGLSDGAGEIERIREIWEVAANRHLEQANQAQRIDRRSLKDQGIDREPTVHLGPGVTALERDGIPSRLGDINRQVVAERHLDRQVGAERHLDRHRHEPSVLQPQLERPPVDNRPVSQAELKEIRAVVSEAIDRLYQQRDQRVQRVLAKAQARETRREKAYRTVQERAPVAPKGLRATFQQKNYQQALVAWDSACKGAARLVEQARQLSARLLEASGAKKLMEWSQEALRRRQPELVAHHDEWIRASPAQLRLQAQPELSAPAPVPTREAKAPSQAGEIDARRDRDRDREAAPASPPAPPEDLKDIKTQAAEGVAALRARLAKDRQVKPEKSPGDKMLERLKAQVEAEHKAAQQKAADQERSRRERDLGLSRGRGPGRDGPGMGD